MSVPDMSTLFPSPLFSDLSLPFPNDPFAPLCATSHPPLDPTAVPAVPIDLLPDLSAELLTSTLTPGVPHPVLAPEPAPECAPERAPECAPVPSSAPLPLARVPETPNGVVSTSELETRVSALLECALTLVDRAPWLREFLFAEAPAADVAMLTAPPALAAACYAHVRETTIELSGAHGGALDSAVTVQWALIPAFCAGGITAGVAVTTVQQHPARAQRPTAGGTADDGAAHAAPPPPEAGCADAAGLSPAHGRFLRDERTGELVLYRHESNGDAAMVHMCLRATTARTRVYLRLRGPRRAAGPTAEHVAFACATSELRFCPSCNAAPATGCACALYGRTPAHALDYADVRTMSNHCGDFSGHAVASVVRGARAPGSMHMLTHAVVSGGKDSASVAALAAWAVRARLAALGPSALVPTLALAPPPMLPAGARARIASLDGAVLGLSTSPLQPGGRAASQGAPPTSSVSGSSSGLASDIARDGASDPAAHLLMASYVQGGSARAGAAKAASPLLGAAAFVRSAVSVGGAAVDCEAERARRQHQRKLRNRMAAARSNQKRKEKYLNLQRDVGEIRERKAALTQRLEQLREENGALRARAQ